MVSIKIILASVFFLQVEATPTKYGVSLFDVNENYLRNFEQTKDLNKGINKINDRIPTIWATLNKNPKKDYYPLWASNTLGRPPVSITKWQNANKKPWSRWSLIAACHDRWTTTTTTTTPPPDTTTTEEPTTEAADTTATTTTTAEQPNLTETDPQNSDNITPQPISSNEPSSIYTTAGEVTNLVDSTLRMGHTETTQESTERVNTSSSKAKTIPEQSKIVESTIISLGEEPLYKPQTISLDKDNGASTITFKNIPGTTDSVTFNVTEKATTNEVSFTTEPSLKTSEQPSTEGKVTKHVKEENHEPSNHKPFNNKGISKKIDKKSNDDETYYDSDDLEDDDILKSTEKSKKYNTVKETSSPKPVEGAEDEYEYY